ncbi:hypothetical protein GW781_14235 [bacterium]|nr:hypothetical protein [bacterium]NCT22297.1 hypothetical protein [bacterium]OIO83234.1 MAG: hypothetical protein AUK01_13115 [Anaerolineae bacterium CG2_30_57_67]
MEEKIIIDRIQQAVSKLMKIDKDLLLIDVNERSITHRLGIYLQEQFPEWDVDCEYNRLIDNKKQMVLTKRLKAKIGETTPEDTQAKTVYPDLIIHHRISTENLVVIEVKKSTNPEPSALGHK